jgi:uncharacterized membrane protein YphA (DoxX/SURF4 family)
MDSSMSFLRSNAWRWTMIVLRVILGAVFIYAGWLKLQDSWRIFAMDIDAYNVLPHGTAVEVVARGLPWFEIVLGVWLIAGFWLRGSATICAGLLTGFFGLMIYAHFKGLQINCGCFGTGEKISWITMLRDGSLLTGALLLAAWSWLRGGDGRRLPSAGQAAASSELADGINHSSALS